MYKIDSRKVNKGDTFVALRGIDGDGHNYIMDAIKLGATKIICEEGSYEVETIIVKDSRKYLEEVLYNEYKDELKKIKIIGVTGTDGKTTTAYFLYQLLNLTGNKCAYISTIGFYIDKKISSLSNTTPDLCEIYNMILTAIKEGCKYLVLEASSQGLYYGRLNTIDFECGIFTNLTMEHLDFHKTMENYASAKKKLFDKCKYKIINNDDTYKDYFKTDDSITYGYSGKEYKLISFKDYVLKYNDKEVIFNVDGLYNAYNLLSAVAALDCLKINGYEKYIPDICLPEGRFNKVEYNKNLIVIDYAHTPSALKKVINLGKSISKNKVITIFNCTGDRLKEKRPIMGEIASTLSDKVIITKGTLNSETLEDINNQIISGIKTNNYEVISDRALAIKTGISYLKENDVLLILGMGHKKSIKSLDGKLLSDIEYVNSLINLEDNNLKIMV